MGAQLKLAAQALAVFWVSTLGGMLVWKLTHQPPPPKVGGPAPTLSLPSLRGNGDVSLASLRGKAVVLNFFASWCHACKREAPVLEHLWQQDRSKGLVVLGVDSNDFHSDGLQFVHAHDVTYPVVFDHYGALAINSYAVGYLPATYVINREGRIVGGEILGPVSDQGYSQTFRRYLRAALKS